MLYERRYCTSSVCVHINVCQLLSIVALVVILHPVHQAHSSSVLRHQYAYTIQPWHRFIPYVYLR